MTKTLMIPAIFTLLLSLLSGQLFGLGIFETRYIKEDFKVFHEGYKETSRYYMPQVSVENLLDDYILGIMNKYIDSADDYVRKKNGERPKQPRKILKRTSFNYRVKVAPYLVMKHEIEKNGSTLPANWTYAYDEAKAAEREVYVKDVAHNISKYILAARTCFDIDPAIMAALIHKESFFSPVAVSHTGAAGLTQFTRVAFGEIAMQTGSIPNEADKDAIAYNLNGINCMEKITGEDIPAIDEIYTESLYYRSQTTEFRAIRSSAIRPLKNYFKDHMLSSVAYGAILLKTYLALECRLAPGVKCYRSKKTGEMIWDREYLYKRALQRYNGDININKKTGKMVKYHYAMDIWKEAAEKIKLKLSSFIDTAEEQAEAKKPVVEVEVAKGSTQSKKNAENKNSTKKTKKSNLFMDFLNYITNQSN